MNKSEIREISKISSYAPTLGVDFAARSLSALIRACRSTKSKVEMVKLAHAMGWHKSTEFII